MPETEDFDPKTYVLLHNVSQNIWQHGRIEMKGLIDNGIKVFLLLQAASASTYTATIGTASLSASLYS